MQIDWFTLVAQLINFVILMWLLQRYLYGPIMATMQAREDKLTNQFAAAEKQEAAARAERDALAAERENLAARREELIQEARSEAGERRRQLIQAAREESEELQARWYAAIEREKAVFLGDIQARMGHQLVDLARRVLGDLAGHSLESAIVDKFLARLENDLAAPQADADIGKIGRVVVRSSLTLPDDQQQKIRTALQQSPVWRRASTGPVADELEIDFEPSAELICGIEVEVGHRRIAWSIRDYLSTIERELSEAIQSNGATARSKRRPFTDETADEILPG